MNYGGFVARVFLSHPYEKIIPTYGKFREIKIESKKCLKNNDSCNTYLFELENHWGTHIDAPAHFFENGDLICDYCADFWVFSHVQMIDISIEPATLLKSGKWLDLIDHETQFLILRSGFGQRRHLKEYCTHNPGIHEQVGYDLRKRYPQIKVIGFDWISLSSFQYREMGRKSHCAFLDPNGDNHPILIVEDMKLDHIHKPLKSVVIAPILIKGVDSSPCTIIGEY